MDYTYRDECIISEKDDIGSFIFLGIWFCATLGTFIIDGYLIYFRGAEGIGSPFLGGIFAIITAAIGITIYHSIHKRRSKALDRVLKMLLSSNSQNFQTILAVVEGLVWNHCVESVIFLTEWAIF